MAEALFQIAEPGQSRSKHACRTRAVGIDLGTTNSLVAIVDAGKPTALADEHGETIVPSVVHYGGDGAVVVGADARDRLAVDFPRDTIASVKRFMGRGPRDAEATRRSSSMPMMSVVSPRSTAVPTLRSSTIPTAGSI